MKAGTLQPCGLWQMRQSPDLRVRKAARAGILAPRLIRTCTRPPADNPAHPVCQSDHRLAAPAADRRQYPHLPDGSAVDIEHVVLRDEG